MNRLYKITLIIIAMATIGEGILIFQQKREMKKLNITIEELSNRGNS